MRVLLVVMGLSSAVVLAACASGGGKRGTSSAPGAEKAVARVLDDFHDAASKPDEERYFSHFAPEGVFIGTDATERWTVPEFREYAHARFATGKGWTYVATARWIGFSDDGKTAWFDEVVRNQKYGDCRGSGVLVLRKGKWLIQQYNLTKPIPNEMFEQVAKMIDGAKGTGK